MTNYRDPRLKAAELSRSEFVGKLDDSKAVDPEQLLDEYEAARPWVRLASHKPLRSQLADFELRYDVPSDEPDAYLLAPDGSLAGFYCGKGLFVRKDLRGQGLGPELVLAGFAQSQWSHKERPVTALGHRAFEKAHDLVVAVSKSAARLTR